MHRTASLCLSLLCVTLVFLTSCAYGIFDDKRLLDTMSSDKAMATNVKTALMKKNVTGALKISVYCFYNNVFLVGEVPEHVQEMAVSIAQEQKPKSVTFHFFPHEESSESDFLLSGRLRAALIEAKGLSSTRVETEVNAGRVVLLGVVGTEHERKTAIRVAHHVDGVRSVTSYLLLPPRPGESEEL